MDKYKLVIFGDTWDVYQTAYQELIENPKVVYIPTFRPKGFKGLQSSRYPVNRDGILVICVR